MPQQLIKREIIPSRLICLSYFAIILIGAVLLTSPLASLDGQKISFIDALFTAASATTVTGLIVKDTELEFSLFGKGVILVLIQIGGLGYMTLAVAIGSMLGKNTTLLNRLTIKESFGWLTFENLGKLARKIFIVALMIELIGFLMLFYQFNQIFPIEKAIGSSVFHAISAFSNAGFSNFSDGLEPFAINIPIVLTIASLIIFGGLGFFVLIDIKNKLFKKIKHLSVHSKLVITTTLILIILGTSGLLVLEWNNGLNQFSGFQKIIVSFFSSVTPRTAGFSIIQVSLFSLSSILLIIILMFIGASPGGTGGGIKTTTFVVAIKSIKNTLMGRELNFFKKNIPQETIKKSFIIILTALLIIISGIFVLSVSERKIIPSSGLEGIIFEEVSAFATVGLSLGSKINSRVSLSFDFSNIGKSVIILTMFFGRIGPLLILSTFITPRRKRISYPEAKIIIG